MPSEKIHIEFPGRLIFIGFGSIGQGTLPLVLRHIGIPKERITIITSDDRGKQEAEEYGIKVVKVTLTRDNYRRELDPYIGRGDFVLNVSVEAEKTNSCDVGTPHIPDSPDTSPPAWVSRKLSKLER